MTRISFAILTHNRRDQVVQAIESAFGQAYQESEIVVLDNGSTDNTYEFLKARFGGQIKLIRLPINLGCPAGRNYLYANCSGNYIINIDDDGFLEEGVASGVAKIFDDDQTIGIIAMRQSFTDQEGYLARSESIIDVASFSGGVSAFRRTMLEAIGAYPYDFFLFSEEGYLGLKAMDSGYRIVSAPHLVMWHPRLGSSSTTSFDYYRFRNPLLVVLRLYPGWRKYKYLVARALRYAPTALQRGSVGQLLRALAYVLVRFPHEIGSVPPVSPDTIKRYHMLRATGGTLVKDATVPKCE